MDGYELEQEQDGVDSASPAPEKKPIVGVKRSPPRQKEIDALQARVDELVQRCQEWRRAATVNAVVAVVACAATFTLIMVFAPK